MYKMSCKMDKHFMRYSMFFHRAPTSNSGLGPYGIITEISFVILDSCRGLITFPFWLSKL